jgi:hypothetical protein
LCARDNAARRSEFLNSAPTFDIRVAFSYITPQQRKIQSEYAEVKVGSIA